MNDWLKLVRLKFLKYAPELLALFDVYATEAEFGRRYINSDLENLGPGAKILEIGAGSLLLSCQLAREGFDITALEPVGCGFSHFDKMRQIVLSEANLLGCRPNLLNCPAEELDFGDRFDYAFSINVMEHVKDVKIVLEKVGNQLNTFGVYRFTCPNYLFPYEPHFNIPTFIFKWPTKALMWSKIKSSKCVSDPVGTWDSLNWINAIQIKLIIRQIFDLKVTFNRNFLVSTLERVALDPEFSSRRSPLIRRLSLMLVRLHIHHLFFLVPAAIQPIIDCRIQKMSNLEKE